jgi:redox-sensitive bicupin YhaK (pirin superfamily)
VGAGQALEVNASHPIEILGGKSQNEMVLLQGKTISEPVVQHGPFVMNSQDEIRQAFMDYQNRKLATMPQAFRNKYPA